MKNTALSAEQINIYTKNKFNIKTEDRVTSTNTLLKEAARAGAPHATVLIAGEQTDGRGRLGRSFYSPKSSGLYMSAILRIDCPPELIKFITPAAAVSVVRALTFAGAENLGIKWVNDIFRDDKKVCGILTEIGFLPDSPKVDFAVVGIGINLNTKIFPQDIKSSAGSVFKNSGCDINKIAAQILDNLFDFCRNLADRGFLEEYKSLSILDNRDVTLISAGGERRATVLGIDDDCRLVVRLSDGTKEYISTGEVSIGF